MTLDINNPLFSSPAVNLSSDQDALRWRTLVTLLQQMRNDINQRIPFNVLAAPGGASLTGLLIKSLGIINVITTPGFNAGVIGANVAAGAISATAFNFVVPNVGGRAQNGFYFFNVQGHTAGATGEFAQITGQIVGPAGPGSTTRTTASFHFDNKNAGDMSPFLWYFPQTGFPPGNYTATLINTPDTGQVLFVNQFFHQMWLLGATS